jgi:uncharacterized protein with PIN domain
MEAIVKFAADRMLARVARWLRILGADTTFDENLDGATTLKAARIEGRIMLTRDKRLKTAPDVLFLESNDFREQLRQSLARYPFDVMQNAFSRCSRCNALLVEVDREIVRLRVAPFVYATNAKFSECPTCAQIYWGGTHRERIIREMRQIGLDLNAKVRR